MGLEEKAAPPGGGASEKVAMPGALGWTELPALPRASPLASRLLVSTRLAGVCSSAVARHVADASQTSSPAAVRSRRPRT